MSAPNDALTAADIRKGQAWWTWNDDPFKRRWVVLEVELDHARLGCLGADDIRRVGFGDLLAHWTAQS